MGRIRAGLPYETLEDIMLFYARFECRKHELADDIEEYAKDRLNRLTNAELVNALSDAIEEMKANT